MGDINIIQYLALSYCLNADRREMINLEQERMKYTMLANNPTLYNTLYGDKSIEGEVGQEVEWITPTSIEETQRLAELFEG